MNYPEGNKSMDNQINVQLVLIYLFIGKTNKWTDAWHFQGGLSDSQEQRILWGLEVLLLVEQLSFGK